MRARFVQQTFCVSFFQIERIDSWVNAFLPNHACKYKLKRSISLIICSNQLLEYSFSRNKPLNSGHEKELLYALKEG